MMMREEVWKEANRLLIDVQSACGAAHTASQEGR